MNIFTFMSNGWNTIGSYIHMDNKKAKELLEKIAKAKEAGLASTIGSAVGGAVAASGVAKPTTPKFTGLGEVVHKLLPFKTKEVIQSENNEAHRQAIQNLIVAGIVGTGAGGGLAALQHYNHTPALKKKNKTQRVVEMPVPYYEKESGDDNVTSKYGLSYYIPGLALAVGGGSLAWQGVDRMLKNKRQQEIDENTDMARAEYESAMKNMYKRSSDVEADLDIAFDELEKKAELNDIPFVGPVNKTMSTAFPNAWGTAKGLMIANALIGLPVGYSIVNNQVKKNSRRKLVDDAMKERARLRAMQSPAEVYAVPTPIE